MIRGHRSRPGVGGPRDARSVALAVLRSVDANPEQDLPRASLTSLVRDVRCDGCGWPLICTGDRTCWLEEPWQHDFTGRLQARAIAALKPRSSPWTRATIIEAVRKYGARTGHAPTVEDYPKDPSLPSTGVLYRHFSSNAEVAVLAGLQPRRRWGVKHKKAGVQW